MASRPWVPTHDDLALAARLGPGSAFLLHDGAYFHATAAAGPGRRPALDLAAGVWERMPARSRAVLRNRIRLTDPIAPTDRAVIDVVAKRVSHVSHGGGEALGSRAPESIDLSADAAAARARPRPLAVHGLVPAEPGAWLRELVPVGAPGPLPERDRPVVAVLADPGGRVRAAAVNAAGRNRTLHAEVCLVQSFGAIPAGWRVYTSLQPCRMCAAILVDAALGPIGVRYLDADPGRLATGTALQLLGWERPIRGPAPPGATG